MLHTHRQGIYKKLRPKTREFVDDYLEKVLKINKFEMKVDDFQKNDSQSNPLGDENVASQPKSNIAKIIDKKKYSNQVVDESGEDKFFSGFDPEFMNFLFPEFEKNILNPFLMKDMEKAVQKLVETVLDNKKVCIYGDYDCDGVPGTALMRDFFEAIKYENVIYYIPDRHKEGYGLNETAVRKLAKEDVSLIVTIDLGITNVKEVALVNELGMEVIITDHHLPITSEDGEVLPKAYAIINNKQSSCSYTDKNLCGSGTVWKLVCAVLEYNKQNNIWKIGEGLHKWMLDLVGIATIADMVPLIGENRTLAIYGLHVIKNTKREGLKTVLKNAKTELKNLAEDDIAFSIAPRVNAASRMDHPVHAMNMFSRDMKLGIDSAHYLEELNKSRKESVATIMKKVYKNIDERKIQGELPQVIVIGDTDWAPGILGLVSSGITEKYNRTSFVWGKGEDDKIFKGSCRSYGDLHVVKLMTESSDLFTHFGGHEEAGGFAIHFDNIHTLEKKLNDKNILNKSKIIKREISAEDVGNNIFEIDLEDVTSDFIAGLSLLAPFGVGNPKPIFKIRDLQSYELKRFGKKNEHIKIIMQSRVAKREAIKFFVDHEKEKELANIVRELQFTLEPGWMGGVPRLKII